MRRARSDERGATLAVVGLTLVVMLVSGAVAVDLSALERRGQSLQTSADAAALAGVTTWALTQDEARATEVVRDMLVQNGVAIGSDVDFSIEFPSFDTVEVVLKDYEPDVMLAGVVPGQASELERAARARHLLCDDGCARIVTLSAPSQPVDVSGIDGYKPILIGDRVYSVSAGGSTIECVDIATSNSCFAPTELFSDPVTTTGIVQSAVVDNLIFFAGWDGPLLDEKATGDGTLSIGCFDATTNTRCDEKAVIENVGQGVVHAYNDRIFVFTADRSVFCYHALTLNECENYIGGRHTALKELVTWGSWTEARSWNGDLVEVGGKAFTTLADDGQVWLHCWDLDAAAKCFDFTPRVLNGSQKGTSDDYNSGRLFFYRNDRGVAESVCSFGSAVLVECYDIEGGAQNQPAELEMAGSLSAVTVIPDEFVGTSTYHQSANRQFFVGSVSASTTWCHDFNDKGPCGVLENRTDGFLAEPFSWEPYGDCLIGIGRTTKIVTMGVDSNECRFAGDKISLNPCMCSGSAMWPPIEFPERVDVSSVQIRALSPFGAQLWPNNGFHEMGDGPLDLNGLVATDSSIVLEVIVNAEIGDDPWAIEKDPILVIGAADTDPHLID